MNDQELDQILEGWTLAPPSPSLRDRVCSQYRYQPPRRFPLGGLSIAAAVCLISVLAFSQTAKIISGFGGVPFTVDLERTSYADNGTVTRTLYTCYELPGARMRFSDTKTEGPCWEASRNLVDGAKFITLRMAPSLIMRPETERERADRKAFLKAGCIAPGDAVLGHENVADYRTVKVLSAARASRRTDWYALDLDCFPMGNTVEETGPGGKLHMRSRETVLAVHKQ
ncbi:MAG TPA: hypothetical protein VGM43_23340 [Bryobacteraceae bacterium]